MRIDQWHTLAFWDLHLQFFGVPLGSREHRLILPATCSWQSMITLCILSCKRRHCHNWSHLYVELFSRLDNLTVHVVPCWCTSWWLHRYSSRRLPRHGVGKHQFVSRWISPRTHVPSTILPSNFSGHILFLKRNNYYTILPPDPNEWCPKFFQRRKISSNLSRNAPEHVIRTITHAIVAW